MTVSNWSKKTMTSFVLLSRSEASPFRSQFIQFVSSSVLGLCETTTWLYLVGSSPQFPVAILVSHSPLPALLLSWVGAISGFPRLQLPPTYYTAWCAVWTKQSLQRAYTHLCRGVFECTYSAGKFSMSNFNIHSCLWLNCTRRCIFLLMNTCTVVVYLIVLVQF